MNSEPAKKDTDGKVRCHSLIANVILMDFSGDEIIQFKWLRTEYASIWFGPGIELMVINETTSNQGWSWTVGGPRKPSAAIGSNHQPWRETETREAVEAAAMKVYVEK